MHVVRLFACTLVLSAVALASNGPLPKSASIDVKNAVEKADLALSEGDKNLAGIQAKGVSGVFSVTNNLRVEEKQ